MPDQISDTADRIMAADFRNIVRKVKEGKPLTHSEIKRIQTRLVNPRDANITVVKNLTELATVLGVSRQALDNWRKMAGAPKPKSNGTHSVTEWRQFATENDLKAGDGQLAMAELKVRKLIAEIEDRELRVAVRKEEYIPLDQVKTEWTTQVGKTRALLEARFLNELPPILVGKGAVEIREELERVLFEVYGILHNGGTCTP